MDGAEQRQLAARLQTHCDTIRAAIIDVQRSIKKLLAEEAPPRAAAVPLPAELPELDVWTVTKRQMLRVCDELLIPFNIAAHTVTCIGCGSYYNGNRMPWIGQKCVDCWDENERGKYYQRWLRDLRRDWLPESIRKNIREPKS